MSEKEEFKNNNNPLNVGIVFLEPLLSWRNVEKITELDDKITELNDKTKELEMKESKKSQLFTTRLKIYWKLLDKKFIEMRGYRSKLDFDANACAYVLLQMNKIQNLFVFQVLTSVVPNIPLPKESYKKNIDIDWFEGIVKRILNARTKRTDSFNKNIELAGNDEIITSNTQKIDIWIGITSKKIVIRSKKGEKEITDKYFMSIGNKKSNPTSIISSHGWDRNYAPPSLFEYLINSVLISALFSTFVYFGNRIDFHVTESIGCIFDLTGRKEDRKILVSNPTICPLCESQIRELEKRLGGRKININIKKPDMSLYDSIKEILVMNWLGDINERDSLLYNLRRNYRSNVDRNSGFNKKWWEKIRDSMIENTAQWTIGIIITAIITFGTGLFGNFLINVFRLG